MFNKIFFGILGAIALFGFVLPYLISAKSNELTILGIFIIVAVFYFAGQKVVQLLTKGDK